MSLLSHPENDVRKAAMLAMELHSGQKRWYTEEPYFRHVERVAETVARSQEYRHDTLAIVAGVLHDAVEDTDYTYKRAFDDFPKLPDLPGLLELLTHNKGVEYRAYLARLKQDPRARVIKRADMCDNIATLPWGSGHLWRKYTDGLLFLSA